jgi:hypothetical protein
MRCCHRRGKKNAVILLPSPKQKKHRHPAAIAEAKKSPSSCCHRRSKKNHRHPAAIAVGDGQWDLRNAA